MTNNPFSRADIELIKDALKERSVMHPQDRQRCDWLLEKIAECKEAGVL